MALLCTNCEREIQGTEFLKCCKCKKTYDIHCSGRSSKLFQLMTKDSKKTWTCLSCRSNSRDTSTPKKNSSKKTQLKISKQTKPTKKITTKSSSPSPSSNITTEESEKSMSTITHLQQGEPDGLMPTDNPSPHHSQVTDEDKPSPSSPYHSAVSTPSQDNITLRRPMKLMQPQTPEVLCTTDDSLKSIRSYDSEDLDAETLLDNCNRSCPDIRATTEETLVEYKNKIHGLELRLQAAEHEIENLILENGTLKKQILDNEHTISNLTRICTST